MIKIFPTILLMWQMSDAVSQEQTFYAAYRSHETLATRIGCKVDEAQHFQYSSTTSLWGTMGGEITLNADVTVHCLGDDHGGKYKSEALKYLVEISNLVLEQNKYGENEYIIRKKRDVSDYFSNAWKKIKGFFKRMFGGRSQETERRQVVKEVVKEREHDDSKQTEDEEEFNVSELSSAYSTPFIFVQLANGSIPEIRFGDSDTDGRIKNFKRHLVDAFATQLNFNDQQKPIVETSVMGEHVSAYNVTIDKESSPHISLAGFGSSYTAESVTGTVMVEKFVTENDILKLAPEAGNEAKNDKDKMALKLQQMQIFKDGKMLASSGTSSLVLLYDEKSKVKRSKRETAEENIMSYFQANSVFEMHLKKRQKRSATDVARLERLRASSFTPSSRSAEIEDNSARHNLQELQKSIQNATVFFQSLIENPESDYNDKMQLLFEMVEREVSLKLDKKSHSVSKAARRVLSETKMQNMCLQNFTMCKDFLQLLALAGGSEAEEVLLSFLRTRQLTDIELITVADIISDTSNPSLDFITNLSELIKENAVVSPKFFGSLVLSTGHLASSASEDAKKIASGVLMYSLREHLQNCHSDPIVLDVLEAIGNLGDASTVSSVLRVSAECQGEQEVQIASAHALRHSTQLPEVRRWMEKAVATGNCELTRAVIGTLLDRISEQEENHDDSWPLHSFNDLDANLQNRLQNLSSNQITCNEEDILLYFRRKKDPRANEISQNYFGRDSEPWNPEFGTRQKRSFWDDQNCQEWTEDSKYRPIQDKEEFAADRATYNKRKSCLAYRRLGVKGANAEIYAGMFAGVKEPSEPPKYKLFTKFVSGLNFLGNKMEIGAFYFYLQGGKTKAYVRILDRTRQEYTHDGCTPTDLKYRPVKHIPLYLISVSAVQLSLGIHLSSQLALDTACPDQDAYRLEPLASVRIGGEATGTVVYARGTVNLAGNFNYKLQLTFTPSPNMCLKGSHGYDPMDISFQTYFQLWNKMKDDWGKFRTWKPTFLSWKLTKGSQKSWFDETCIINDTSASPQSSEIETERK